ncbi:MAG: DUF3418 domain-containing protein, partial [Phycisphaeraceae bacterium]
GVSGRKLRLWPGSVLFKKRPKWIVAAELVETNQLYARLVAPIRPKWIEAVAPQMLNRKYGRAGFDAKTGRTVIAEKATLRGLVVVPRRDVPYGKIDPVKARKLFIREALVQARHPRPPRFLTHNLEQLEEAAKLEAKTRTKGLVAGEEELIDFYDRRLPEDIDSCGKLEGFLKRETHHRPDLLKMGWSDVLTRAVDPDNHGLPDELRDNGLRLPLRYTFDPNAEDDGVTATVPVAALPQLDAQRLEWLVPGLLREKVAELLRTLPKAERRRFVPLPQTAVNIEPVLLQRFGQGSLIHAVAAAMKEVTGKAVHGGDFEPAHLPAKLRMNLEAIDDDEAPIAAERDVRQLQQRLADASETSRQRIEGERYRRDHVKTWDFGPLPEHETIRRGQASFRLYPTLVDEGESAAVRLYADADAAAIAHRRGVVRLLSLGLAGPIQSHLKRWEQGETVLRLAATWEHADTLPGLLRDALAAQACLTEAKPIRDGMAFAKVLEAGWDRLAASLAELGPVMAEIFEANHEARLAMERLDAGSPAQASAIGDAKRQLAMAMPRRFLAETPMSWLSQLPRHLRALTLRLRKLAEGRTQRDADAMASLVPHVERLRSRWPEPFDVAVLHRDPELATYRWMVAEFRVSLFAQELGVALPVSAKRLERQWEQVTGG